MSNAAKDQVDDPTTIEDDAAGEITLPGPDRVGLRARALAGIMVGLGAMSVAASSQTSSLHNIGAF